MDEIVTIAAQDAQEAQEAIGDLAGCISIIKSRGKYAYAYNNGEISDDEANPMLFAYVDDDLYDYIADAIAVFAESNHDPFPYKGNDSIYR